MAGLWIEDCVGSQRLQIKGLACDSFPGLSAARKCEANVIEYFVSIEIISVACPACQKAEPVIIKLMEQGLCGRKRDA